MNIQLALDDRLIHGESSEELQRKLRMGLIVLEYLRAELSLGEVAELLGMAYEETMEWLNSIGVPTSRPMSPEMAGISRDNIRRLLETRDHEKQLHLVGKI
ncbi:MAG: UPF0175 family protein [Candidatus Competibacteraceae bacterium]